METMYKQYSQLSRYRESKIQVKVALYVRCSHDEQKKNGYTIKDQIDYGYMFAKENDLIVTGEYVDEGISATLEIEKRKALAQMLTDAKEGKFDIVVFKCIDRFFRNTEEYWVAQRILRKAGVTWLSIEEADLDPDDEDIFKISLYLALAEAEARKVSKRIRFNNAMRIKNKQVVTSSFLFPWHIVGEPKNRHLERNMDEKDRLFDILEHFETFQSKGNTLAYHNLKYNTPISLTTLTNLLTDTLLYGEYKGIPDYVEPWITKERFDSIQAILKRNSRRATSPNNTYIFAGILKCRCCGRNLVGNKSNMRYNNVNYSYRCNKHRQEKTCANNQSVTEWMIEEQLLNNLEQYIKDEIIKVESIEKKKSPVVDHSKKIAAIKKEMGRLNKMYRKGNIEEDEYDEEFSELKRELKILEEAEKPVERNLDGLKKLLESDFRTIYEALDKEHKKAFWRAVIKEFTLDENKKIVPESIIFF